MLTKRINICASIFMLYFLFVTFAESVFAQKSTALLDLERALTEKFFESATSDLAFETFEESLNEIPENERDKAQEIIFNFIKKGFSNINYNIFKSDYTSQRERFFRALQDSLFRFGINEIKELLNYFRERPGQIDFSSFIEEGWIEFVREKIGYDTNGIIQNSIIQLLDSLNNEDVDKYFKVLYFSYKVYEQLTQNRFNNHVTKRYLNKLTPELVNQIYHILNQSYWSTISDRKQWLLKEMASRLYRFPVSNWSRVENSICYDLALILSQEGQVTLINWLVKMIKARELTLLAYFLGRGDINLIQAYNQLEPYFRNNQRLFIDLHVEPPKPSAMWILNREDQNLARSVQLLTSFFALNRQNSWTGKLWRVLKDYYQRYDLKEELFKNIIVPIYTKADSSNIVRQKLLQDARRAESYLLDEHRYRIGHYIFSHCPSMRTIVPTADEQKPTCLEFVVDIYITIEPIGGPLNYINNVIGEPLLKLADAFLGRGNEHFSLDQDENERNQLIRLLNRIKDIKQEYHLAAPNIKVLIEISHRAYQEIESVIGNTNTSTQGSVISPDNVRKITSMIRLILKISAVLEDDTYLTELLRIMRERIYGLHQNGGFTKLPEQTLGRSVKIFKSIHPDLIDALKSVNNARFFEIFYEQLYIPLRNIRGFFRRVTAQPYIDFIREFQERGISLENELEQEIGQLSSVNGYIDAEQAIAELLGEYSDKLNINIWQSPYRFPLCRNINLGVIYRLLTQIQEDGWKGGKANYRGVLDLFLNNMNRKDMLQKGINEYYSPWDFFTFLSSILDLYEIYSFPFHGVQPDALYTGTPKEGICVRIPGGVTSRNRVDGTVRMRLYQTYRAIHPIPEEKVQKLIEVSLFLPNSPNNNLSGQNNLREYRAIKRDAFNIAKNHLKACTDSSCRLIWLKWLARIDKSLMSEQGFGFRQIRDQYLPYLNPMDQQRLAFEEFRLDLVNGGSGDWTQDVEILSKHIYNILEVFYSTYKLLNVRRTSDDITRVIIDLFRRLDPEEVMTHLRDEDIENLWFLTIMFDDLMTALENFNPPNQRLQTHFARTASGVMELYLFFLPYIHGRFNVDHLFKFQNALAAFSMLNIEIKRKLFNSMNRWNYAKAFNQDNQTPKRIIKPDKIKSFLILHNFLPLYILKRCLRDNSVFMRLLEGKEIDVILYNFKLLAQRENKVNISMRNLFNETLGGIDLNRDIITNNKRLEDRDYLEYFFGDMRRLFNNVPAEHIPQNFDQILKILIEIAYSEEYQNRLNEICSNRNVPEEIKERARNFPNDIRESLEQHGYDYFGRVLATNFSSLFNIQRACELAVDKVVETEREMNEDMYSVYRDFYIKSLFEGDQFRQELLNRMISIFYPGPDENESIADYKRKKQKQFCLLIDGNSKFHTRGLKEYLRKRNDFENKYKNAMLDLLQALFEGRNLQDDSPFIGDLIWCERDDNGQRRIGAFDMEHKAEQIYELLNWIYNNMERYRHYPEIRSLFGEVQ